jgi:hypothetical protein
LSSLRSPNAHAHTSLGCAEGAEGYEYMQYGTSVEGETLPFPLDVSFLFFQRFRREASNWGLLSHPNVAVFHGIAFSAGGRPGLVLKWYGNGTAAEYLRGESPTRKLSLVRPDLSSLPVTFDLSTDQGHCRGSDIHSFSRRSPW